MLRPALLAAAVVVLPFAGRALAQEPTTHKDGAAPKATLAGVRITLRNEGEVVGVLELPKAAKGTIVGQARQTRVANAPHPIDRTVQVAQAQTAERTGRTTTFSGDVVLQIRQNGRTIMEFKVDEATMVTLTE